MLFILERSILILKLLKKRDWRDENRPFWENDLHHVDQYEKTNQKSLEQLEKSKQFKSNEPYWQHQTGGRLYWIDNIFQLAQLLLYDIYITKNCCNRSNSSRRVKKVAILYTLHRWFKS